MGDWLPGAKVIKAYRDAGSMLGGNPRVVWHTTENDPNTTSASSIANYLNGTGNQVHLVWNPVTGECVQMIPASRGGRGLENHAGGVETNRQGKYCIQIEVVGKATQPFTNGPCKGLGTIVTWLRSLGIPDAWPAGRPLPYPKSYGDNGQRSATNWLKGGHFCHSQVPENVHGDAGAIDVAKILGAGTKPVVAKPAVKPVVNKPKPAGVVIALQKAVHISADGIWNGQTDRALLAVRYGYHAGVNVKELQGFVGTKPDGVWGNNSKSSWLHTVMAIQHILGVRADGDWGKITDAAFAKLRKQYKI